MSLPIEGFQTVIINGGQPPFNYTIVPLNLQNGFTAVTLNFPAQNPSLGFSSTLSNANVPALIAGMHQYAAGQSAAAGYPDYSGDVSFHSLGYGEWLATLKAELLKLT
jgi:hypothetical protein